MNILLRRAAAAVVGLIVTSLAVNHALADPGDYVRMQIDLRRAAVTGRVRVITIGESAAHRSIPMAVIGDPSAAVRVLILCRQHGNEPAGTTAALRLVGRAAAGDPTVTVNLKNVLLLVVPMVNPDGAERSTRFNSVGADLNRDWIGTEQPETRAVVRVFNRFRPQVVLDEHQWTVSDRRGYNALEITSGPDVVTQTIERQAAPIGADTGIPLQQVRESSALDPRLAHRYFQAEGADAFLLETTPAVDSTRRIDLYYWMIIKIARLAEIYVPRRRLSSAAICYLSTPRHPRRTHSIRETPPVGLLSLCIAILFLAARSRCRFEISRSVRITGRRRSRSLRHITDLAGRIQQRRWTAGASRACTPVVQGAWIIPQQRPRTRMLNRTRTQPPIVRHGHRVTLRRMSEPARRNSGVNGVSGNSLNHPRAKALQYTGWPERR